MKEKEVEKREGILTSINYAYEAPCNQVTSSKPPQSKVEEKCKIKFIILQRPKKSERQKKFENVVAPRIYIEVIKDRKQQRIDPPLTNDVFIRSKLSRKSISSKYPNIFLGYCYSCIIFGHKSSDCKAYDKGYYQGHCQNHRSKSCRNTI